MAKVGKLSETVTPGSLIARVTPYPVLLAEVLVFYRHVLFSTNYAIPWDLRYYHLPMAEFIAKSFRGGELPMWDPFTYCGFPLFANVQSQLFYPPAAWLIAMSNWLGGARLLDVLEWQIVLHVFLAGVFAYHLLRRFGVTISAALLGATVFQLGGFFASQTQHLGAMCGGAWLPLAWLSVIELAARFRVRWMAALAASFAMAALAGFPAVAAMVAASSLLLGVIMAAFGRARIRLAAAILGAGAWSVLLAAVQLIPALQLAGLSAARFRAEGLASTGGLPLQSLMSLIIPNYFGIFDLSRYSAPWNPTFLYVYCGVAGLVTAVIGALLWRKIPQSIVFATLTLASAFWMLGDSTLPGRLLARVLPGGLRGMMYPESAMLAFSLGMAVLAGLGATFFRPSRSPYVGAVLVFFAAFDLIAVGSGRPMNTAPLAVEPGLTRESFDGSAEVLSRVRALAQQTSPPSRIDTVQDSMNWAAGATLTEVPTPNGNDPLALARVIQVRLCLAEGHRWGRYYEVENIESPVLDLLNVRYLLSRKPLGAGRLGAAHLRTIAQLPGRVVYENTEALPRFFLVGRVRPAASMEQALSMIRGPRFDPRELAVVEEPEGFRVFEQRAGGGSVRVIEYSARRVLLESDSTSPAFLVTSEVYYPGWRAFIDGHRQDLVLTNVAFRGLRVPAGRRRIEMRFEPDILRYSAAISAVAWAAWLFCLLPRRRFRDRGEGAP